MIFEIKKFKNTLFLRTKIFELKIDANHTDFDSKWDSSIYLNIMIIVFIFCEHDRKCIRPVLIYNMLEAQIKYNFLTRI